MGAAEIEDRAAHWLARRDTSEWTEEDRAALDAWLVESTAHRVAYLRLESVWRRADRLGSLRIPEIAEGTSKPAPATATWVRWLAAGLAIAAVLGAAALALDNPGLWVGIGQKSYATKIGGHETVPLPDGSRLELNTDTRLRAAVDAQSRAVWLDRGEAYFEVVHDESRPFVVYAGPRRVTVLGTKFSVRRDGDQVEVAVIEGRVQVDAAEKTKDVAPSIITRGDIAVAKGDSLLVAPKSVEKVTEELSWRHGMLVFEQSTLAEAVGEFNRYNRKKLVVIDPKAASMRIGGSFEAANVDAFVRLLERGFRLRVEDRGDEIAISS